MPEVKLEEHFLLPRLQHYVHRIEVWVEVLCQPGEAEARNHILAHQRLHASML